MKLVYALRKVFGLNNIVITLGLMCVWILLMESVSAGSLISGLIFSILTLWFCNGALPPGKISNVKLHKLALYPFFLLVQVYKAGFHVIKLIFTDATAEVVQVSTKLTNESLRIILLDSITLTPGSIAIKAKGNKIRLLWLKGKNEENLTKEEVAEHLKGPLESWLLKAQIEEW